MRLKLLTILLFVVVLPSHLYSQIEDEIRAYVDSSEVMVQRGKLLMLKQLNDNNLSKTKEIYDYLNELTKDSPYAAFYYNEELFINILTEDWKTVEKLMLNIGFMNDLIYTDAQTIAQKAAAMIAQNSQTLLISCEKSNIDDQPKMLIRVLLKYLDSENQSEEYNALFSAYKKQYPNKKYESFEKGFMPPISVKFAWTFSAGAGMVFPTGDLGLDFKEAVSYNAGMDFNINKVYSSLFLHGANLKLQRPFIVVSDNDSLNFVLNEEFNFLEAGLKCGYFIVRSNRFHVAPFGSVLGSSLKSTKYDNPEDDDLEYEIFNSFAYGVGLHTEVRVHEFKKKNIYYGNPDTYLSIKLDAGYNKIAKFKDKTSLGDTPYFNIALVFGIGDF